MESIRAFLTEHNFDPAQAEITVAIVILFHVFIFYLFTRSTDKSDVVTQVLKIDRRSVEKYAGPATKKQIMGALECAIHAPNHFLNEPWRFRLVGSASKKKLGELASKFKEDGDFGSVPDFLVVSFCCYFFFFLCVLFCFNGAFNSPFFSSSLFLSLSLQVSMVKPVDEEWNTKSLENHAATSCAVQNFMVSCASQGIGTKWMTGKMGIDGNTILKEVCNYPLSKLDASEHYMGTILVGIPAIPMSEMKVPNRKTGLKSPVFSETA